MRFFIGILFILCLLAPCPATAGAWLRAKGSSFVSVAFTSNWFLDTTQASYLEFGVRDDLTIGADLDFARSRDGLQKGVGTVFLRRPLGATEGAHRWAYELGVGASWSGDLIVPHLRTGLSWGRGFTFREKGGWLAVDSSVRWDLHQRQHIAKIDATLGLTFNPSFSGMLQVFTSHVAGDSYTKIAPSLLFTPRRGDSKIRIQIGSEIPIDETDDAAIKFGLWREF